MHACTNSLTHTHTHKHTHTHTQGFGKWDGVYLNIYEGYLFRIGAIVEWHHGDSVQSWSNTTDTVSVLVTTSDLGGRVLRVNFSDFQQRQFSMRVAVEGKDASDRCVIYI